MKYAIIDVGTNSIRLMLCDVICKKLYNIQKFVKTTRLGKDSYDTKILKNDRILDTINQIVEFKSIADKENAQIHIFATSALRNAKNKNEFIDLLREKTGLEIKIISGIDEAKFSYYGVLYFLQKNDIRFDKKILIIDIGGGSTEIIMANKNNIEKIYSFDIGVVRCTDLYDLNNFDENFEIRLNEFKKNIRKSIEKEFEKENVFCVCVSGSVSQIAMIDLKISKFDAEKISSHILNIKNLKFLYKKLYKMNYEEKIKIIGMKEDRANIIVAGLIILIEIMDYFNIESINISNFDNLEGFLYDFTK